MVRILFATLINCPIIEAVPVTVAVSYLDNLMPLDYLDLFKAGAKHLVLAENWLGQDGSIIFPRKFGGESLSSSLWQDLYVYQPWKYADKYYSVLDSESLDFKTQISIEWAGNITQLFANMSANISDLSLTIVPEGRYNNLSNSNSYRGLINDGAPVSGDGYFDGFYYNSQKQVKEKAQLVKTRRLGGLAIFFPSIDLPPTNASSLLHAAVSG
ncbi:hypothetical protein Pmar_PMAR001381 [Perkinsus marinus ATCC 50983]|uniref:Uncharacterized protein n=1 Tax=Perkinsus marinus (strain ATCC 50983 / TXsc) TaxID=423536 RepID=C5KJJ7_PERM5|nr:hypothetical protein Pmar_PMAR001381 [Perkinsus marinus ATCC 50983]EER15331.1 hypothetical protein Pmar_PMAR001381 [Perkinsus marinus ATCC 50983]|eukprot:XP_002783535.1 hypothetical protein Pmar_PMAR001381 [Perkinsus marinus ATCC 50983]